MPKDKLIKFYGVGGEYGFLSNFWMASFEIGGTEYKSVEHYFQCQKSLHNFKEFDIIKHTDSAMAARKMGRRCTLRPDWEYVKDSVMSRGVYAKFVTHRDLYDKLLGTAPALLVENSPTDKYWGGGIKGSHNRLGSILMTVREVLMSSDWYWDAEGI